MNDIITFNPAMQATDPTSDSASKAAGKCVNLRLSAEGSSPCLTLSASHTNCVTRRCQSPTARLPTAARTRRFCFIEGLNLVQHSPRAMSGASTRRHITTLPSPPGAAIAEGDTLKLMTPEGVRHITADPATGRLTDRGVMPRLPDIRFVTHTTGSISAPLPQLRLGGGYARSQGPLTASDLSLLASQLDGLYESVYTQASTMGLCLQPRLMAWRILDGHGNELTRSIPVWAAPGGFQCTGAMTGTIAKENGIFAILNGIKAEATAYATRLRIDGTMTDTYWLSPVPHPRDFSPAHSCIRSQRRA